MACFLTNCLQNARNAASDNPFFQNFLGENTSRPSFGLAPGALGISRRKWEVSSNLCFHCAKFEVDKHQSATSMKKTVLKPCLAKQHLNVFKLWCEWGISYSGATLWNSLPCNLRMIKSFNQFKSKVRHGIHGKQE